MAQNDWSSPSGSRWEPVPPPRSVAPAGGSAPAAGRARRVSSDPCPRFRRPLIAVLLTMLGAGTASAAYAEGDGTGTPPASASSHVAGGSDHVDLHAHTPPGSSS
jgi:hypothetical protein